MSLEQSNEIIPSAATLAGQEYEKEFEDEIECDNEDLDPVYLGTTYIIHHGDCDGWAAAAIAAGTLGTNNGKTLVRKPAAYGEAFPFENLKREDEVYILDFSYSREILDDVYSKVSKLVVLDHHKSAEAHLADAPYAVFDLTKSGVLLAWEYFVPEYPATDIVELLDCYDLWNKKHHKHSWEKIVKFHLACNAHLDNFEFWTGLTNGYQIDPKLWDLAEEEYTRFQSVVEEVKASATTVVEKINGENVCIFTCSSDISLVSDALYTDETLNAPLVICYLEKETHYLLSFRGKLEASYYPLQMAKVFGGGGHLLASGARIPKTVEFEDIPAYLVEKLKIGLNN